MDLKKIEAKLVKHLEIGRLRPCSFTVFDSILSAGKLHPTYIALFPANTYPKNTTKRVAKLGGQRLNGFGVPQLITRPPCVSLQSFPNSLASQAIYVLQGV